jgi:hypothetical protein
MSNLNAARGDDQIRHWLEAARVAAEVLEFCMAQAVKALREDPGGGAVVGEASEAPTAPIRPRLE